MESTNAPGEKLLKVIGIIGIISTAFWISIAFILSVVVQSIGLEQSVDLDLGIIIVVTSYHMFMYIMAVILCKSLEKAGLLLILGYIDIAFIVINAMVGGLLAVVLLPIHVAFPVFIIVGAVKNRKAFEIWKFEQDWDCG